MKKILETLNRKWAEYLLEVLVITIGILGAFVLNNWNEHKKEQKQASIILRAIRTDMIQDIEGIERGRKNYERKLAYFQLVDPGFDRNSNFNFSLADTISLVNYGRLFGLARSFRSNTSTFDAMISEGHSDLIANRELISRIQRFYKEAVPPNLDLYQNTRLRQNEINLKCNHAILHQSLQ